jgi:hypothetical protein
VTFLLLFTPLPLLRASLCRAHFLRTQLAGAPQLASGGVSWAVNERQAEALVRAHEALMGVSRGGRWLGRVRLERARASWENAWIDVLCAALSIFPRNHFLHVRALTRMRACTLVYAHAGTQPSAHQHEHPSASTRTHATVSHARMPDAHMRAPAYARHVKSAHTLMSTHACPLARTALYTHILTHQHIYTHTLSGVPVRPRGFALRLLDH